MGTYSDGNLFVVYDIRRQVFPTAPSPTTTHLMVCILFDKFWVQMTTTEEMLFSKMWSHLQELLDHELLHCHFTCDVPQGHQTGIRRFPADTIPYQFTFLYILSYFFVSQFLLTCKLLIFSHSLNQALCPAAAAKLLRLQVIIYRMFSVLIGVISLFFWNLRLLIINFKTEVRKDNLFLKFQKQLYFEREVNFMKE